MEGVKGQRVLCGQRKRGGQKYEVLEARLSQLLRSIKDELNSEAKNYTPDSIRLLFQDFQLIETELGLTESDNHGPFPMSQQPLKDFFPFLYDNPPPIRIYKQYLVQYFVNTMKVNIERVFREYHGDRIPFWIDVVVEDQQEEEEDGGVSSEYEDEEVEIIDDDEKSGNS
jgi:hypothetical protein